MEIPRYNQSVGVGDMPGVRVPGGYTARDFGAGTAAQIQQSGAVMQDVAQKMDIASVINAESDLKNKTTEFLYKDLFQRKGNAAATADKDFDSFYTSAANEASAGLSGRAKTLMQQRTSQQRAELFPRVQSHMMQQAEVATQDALSGLTYSSALAFSQPGAYLDTGAAEKMRLDILGATGAAMRGRDPNAVKAKADEIWQHSMVASLKTMQQQNDIEGVKKWKELYEKKVDPRLTAPIWGWADEKTKDNEDIAIARGMFAQFGNNVAAAESYIKGMTGGKGGSFGIDAIKAEAAKYKGMTYEMDNEPGHMDCSLFTQKVYGALGLQLPRTADYQYKQFADKGQIISDKAQMKPGDIVFFKNTYQDETVDNNGITHVGIYQGDGKVLQSGRQSGVGGVVSLDESHFAGFAHTGTAGGSGPAFDLARQERVRKQYLALANQQDALEAKEEKKKYESLQNNLIGVTDQVQQIELWKNSGLKPYQIANGIDAVVKKVNTETEKSMVYQLEIADMQGNLSAGDIMKAAPYLSGENQIKYLKKLATNRAGEEDKEGKESDLRLKQDLDTAFLDYGGNKEATEQKQSSLTFVRDQLDRENVKGAARYVRGLEILRDNKMINENGKANQDAVKAYIVTGQSNSEERSRLVASFGQDVVRLATIGHSGMKNDPQYFWQINQFLSSIGKRIEAGDNKAQEALDLLVRQGKVINTDSFNLAYSIVTKGQRQ